MLRLVAAGGLLVACAADPSDVPVASTDPVPAVAPGSSAVEVTTPETLTTTVAGGLPPEVTVTVEYVPNLALLRSLDVHLVNSGAVDMEVTSLSYRTPFIDPVVSPDDAPIVGPGLARDVELGLGEATCPAGAGPSVVDITVTIDGRPWTGSYPILDPERLQQLNERECGQRAVLEVAALALGDAPTTQGDVLTTTIDMARRRGTEPVTITETGGTLLFQVLPDGPAGALVTMASDSDAAALTVEVRTTRCDAHVVSGSTLSYRFPVWVQVGDAEPQYVFLTPGPGLRAGLEALVQECLAREGSGAQGT
jgi:hypothetical protein